MSKVSSFFVSRPVSPVSAVRVGLLAVAVALVMVPTVARARQHVEHRDATRLSIRHSWIGIAPPAKASVSPVQVAVVAPPVVEVGLSCPPARVTPAHDPVPHIVDSQRLDPPRGPPPSLA